MSSGGKMASIAELFNGGTRWTVETGRVEELFEDEDGHFATVLMGAEEEEITVARATLYIGDEYGLFAPLEEGQNVPIFIPANNPNLSPFTFGVIGANVHKVPDDVLENPDDFWLIVKPDQHLRLRVSGDNAIASVLAKNVLLGLEALNDPDADRVVMWKELKAILADFRDKYVEHTHSDPVSGDTGTPSNVFDFAGNIAADKPASSVVKGVL